VAETVRVGRAQVGKVWVRSPRVREGVRFPKFLRVEGGYGLQFSGPERENYSTRAGL